MINFLSYLINGISLGSVYAIIALGYTMVYGIAKMLNFAHGDIIMVGGFTTFTVVSTRMAPRSNSRTTCNTTRGRSRVFIQIFFLTSFTLHVRSHHFPFVST